MPGLVGVAGCSITDNHKKAVIKMENMVSHEINQQPVIKFEDNFFTCSVVSSQNCRMQKNTIREELCSDDAIRVFFYGEIYILGELSRRLNPNKDAFLTEDEFFKTAFSKQYRTVIEDLLRSVDGCYCCVVYDQESQKVFLVTDRYGYKYLYFAQRNEGLYVNSLRKCHLKRTKLF